MDCSMPGLSVPHHLPEFAQVHVHCIAGAVQPSHPLLPSSPSAPNLYQHQKIFQWVICAHQIIKILELQLQHQSFQWIFRVHLPRIDRFDLFAVQGIFRSLLQHHSSKASILWHSAFSMVQLSQLYVTTGKTTAFTIRTFVGRVMSLFFNTLSWFVILLHVSLPCGKGAYVTQWSYEPYHAGPPKKDRSWQRVLTKHDPLEEGTAHHPSIPVMRTSWTV